MYINNHPLNKNASNIVNAIGNNYNNSNNYGFFSNLLRKNYKNIVGGLAGIPIGGYLGQLIFNNSLPSVKTLPKYQQPDFINILEKNNSYYWK